VVPSGGEILVFCNASGRALWTPQDLLEGFDVSKKDRGSLFSGGPGGRPEDSFGTRWGCGDPSSSVFSEGLGIGDDIFRPFQTDSFRGEMKHEGCLQLTGVFGEGRPFQKVPYIDGVEIDDGGGSS
jgi:hypothetical protein